MACCVNALYWMHLPQAAEAVATQAAALQVPDDAASIGTHPHQQGGGYGYGQEAEARSLLDNQLAARAARAPAGGGAGGGGALAGDDWGNEQLGEDLLPM